MDFDLRLLRHARALAEEGNYVRAARSLHLTQPALTRSVQELERRTGLKLFDRDRAGVEPTDVGRLFLARARELLDHAESVERDLASIRGTGTGSLVIGSGVFPTAIFMADALASFLGKHPGVAVRVVNEPVLTLLESLRRREVDLIVTALPPKEETAGLAIEPLAPRQGRFLVRSGHALAGRREVTLAEIVRFPFLCTGRLPSDVVQHLLDKRVPHQGSRPIPDVAVDSHPMMLRVATTTDHVLLSSLAASREAIERGQLVPLSLVDPAFRVGFAVVRLESRTLPPIADALMAEIVAADSATAAIEREIAARIDDREPVAPRRAPKPRQPATAAR